jgi:hypothetical protein
MSERRTFSVGVHPDVQQYRRTAENKLAWVCFGKHDRKEVHKYLIYEKIFSAIALASDEKVREFFADE